MAKPPVVIPRDLADLPHRISVRQVLALAGYSRATLTARIAAGRMPCHIDEGRDGRIYLRDAVLRALGLSVPSQCGAESPAVDPAAVWQFKPDAYAAALARNKAGAILQRNRRRPDLHLID